MTDPAKPKKPVEQKTLDMLAKGRAARADKVAAAKAAAVAALPHVATTSPPTTKTEVPDKRPPRCMNCYARPCDHSGKRCPK